MRRINIPLVYVILSGLERSSLKKRISFLDTWMTVFSDFGLFMTMALKIVDFYK